MKMQIWSNLHVGTHDENESAALPERSWNGSGELLW